MCTANTLVRAVRSHVAAATLQKHITGLIESEKTEVITEAALTIASNEDKDAKNAELSTLRTQIARACESLGMKKHTVKGKDMKWQEATKQEGSGPKQKTPMQKLAGLKSKIQPKETPKALREIAYCNGQAVEDVLAMIALMDHDDQVKVRAAILASMEPKAATTGKNKH